MTDEEIKKLAEECSLYYQGRPAKRGYELSNRLTIESYALMTIKWLSERYCIVDRGVLKERYKESELQSMSNSRIDMVSGTSRMILLESIFGKDMFEEDKI